jgi:peroxiredoxin Q/BCP
MATKKKTKKKPTKKTVTKKTAAKATAAKATASKKTSPAPSSKPKAIVGKKAPSFKLFDQSQEEISSASLAGQPYVLYFYPRDNTPGCTREACDFRDLGARFKKLKVRVFGVSADSVKSHGGFAEKFSLPFSLLSDPDKKLISAYGAWVKKQNYGREYLGIERCTYLIDAEGKIKKAWRQVKVNGHVEQVLEAAGA